MTSAPSLGRADDTENVVPGSSPTVVTQGKTVSLITESEAAETNVTTLDLPVELELEDESTINHTAVRLHVASLLRDKTTFAGNERLTAVSDLLTFLTYLPPTD